MRFPRCLLPETPLPSPPRQPANYQRGSQTCRTGHNCTCTHHCCRWQSIMVCQTKVLANHDGHLLRAVLVDIQLMKCRWLRRCRCGSTPLGPAPAFAPAPAPALLLRHRQYSLCSPLATSRSWVGGPPSGLLCNVGPLPRNDYDLTINTHFHCYYC